MPRDHPTPAQDSPARRQAAEVKMARYITIAHGIAKRLSEKWRHFACTSVVINFCTSPFCVGVVGVARVWWFLGGLVPCLCRIAVAVVVVCVEPRGPASPIWVIDIQMTAVMRREFGTAHSGTALIGGRARARASERSGPCPLFTNVGPAESLRSGVHFFLSKVMLKWNL